MKHIIFDIGNVLLAFQPQAFLQKHFAPSVVDDLMAMVFGSAEWDGLGYGYHDDKRRHPCLGKQASPLPG